MTSRGASRRLGLLTTTLTELLLMLFFVVLLLGLRIHADDRATITRGSDEVTLAQDRLTEATKKLVHVEAELEATRATLEESGQWPEDFKRLVRQAVTSRAETQLLNSAVGTKAENIGLREQLSKAETALVAEREASKGMSAALDRSFGKDRAELVREMTTKDALAQAEIGKLKAAAAVSERDQESLRREVGNRTAQVKYLQGQLGQGGNGMDHPPCWVDASGRIEYLIRAEVGEGRIGVGRLWTAARETDAQALPGLLDLVAAGEMTATRFVEMAAPILEWSKRQDPQCRHFVRIDDRAETKNAFKEGLLAIESAFYKYLER